jgi:hypothetical protein
MIRFIGRSLASAVARTIVPAPPEEDIYVPETIPDLKIGLDGSDASKVVLLPASTDVDKWIDKSAGAWEHLEGAGPTNNVVYDAAGGRLNYANATAYLVKAFANVGFSGVKSVTIGATVNPPTLSTTMNAVYSISDASFTVNKDICVCGALLVGATPRYRFFFDADSYDFGTPAPGTPQSVVFRYKNVSPGVNEFTAWVDGVKTGPLAGTATGQIYATQHSVSGRTWWNNPLATNNWGGYIHQTAAYSRALTDEEVSSLIAFLDAKK